MKMYLMFLLGAAFLTSCGNDSSIDLSGVDPDLTVPPTQVMVLGTAHLSGYKDKLTLDDLEPLMQRLETYAPDIICLLYTSPSPRDRQKSRMPSSA